jgi:hypothetical protein
MKRFKFLSIPGMVLVVIAVIALMMQSPSSDLTAQNKPAVQQYEVLSPWAVMDPIPLRGLTSPRLDTLAGKRIGFFVNYKRAAMPSAQAIEKQLSARYPDIVFSYYHSTEWNVDVAETQDRAKFEAWVKSQDAIIATIGD